MLYVLTAYELNCVPSQNSHTKDPWCDCIEDRALEIIEVKGRLVKMGPTPTRLVFMYEKTLESLLHYHINKEKRTYEKPMRCRY